MASPRIDKKLLVWDTKTRRLIGYASDLKLYHWPVIITLYNGDDECDYYYNKQHVVGGRLEYVIYENASTIQLKIYNK